jgi:hypothetical protein
MRVHTPKSICTAFAFLALAPFAAPRLADAQQTAFAGTIETPAVIPNSAFIGDTAANEIVSKVIVENERRRERLQHYTVTRSYEIRTHEGKMAAQDIVRMEYRAPDTKTFEKTSEKGSGIVRRLVFDRLMDSESEASSGKQRQESALTPENYEFHYAGEENVGPYHCFVLQVVPKRKDKYLFEGRIWIDSKDFAVAKIEGRPAKRPSFWVNQADFVREYQKVDEFWLPLRDETQVEVKIYGKRVLIIDHGPYVFPGEAKSAKE